MKIIKRLLLCALGLILLLGVFFPTQAAADEFTCEMRATLDNYHVYVRDLDRSGNPTRDILYRGWLMRGACEVFGRPKHLWSIHRKIRITVIRATLKVFAFITASSGCRDDIALQRHGVVRLERMPVALRPV